MKPRILPLGLLLPLLSISRLFGADAPVAKPSVASLPWLAGVWSFERNGRTVTECWTEPAGGLMLGTGQTVVKERTVEYEFFLLRADAEGTVVYVARPSGQAETTFKLVRLTEREAVFEKPAHDFPQKNSCTLQPDGTLLAAIEGARGGKARRLECPGRHVKYFFRRGGAAVRCGGLVHLFS